MGLLYSDDIDRIQLGYFKEAARLRGTTVYFYETLSETKDLYTDIDIEKETNPKSVDIIFEQYPINIKTLKKYGWYNKDSEDNPHTAFVPLDLSILQRWQEVLIPARIIDKSLGSGWRRFHITKIQTVMDHPFYYLVALAPIFEDNSPTINRELNNNFLDFNSISEV